MHYCSIWGLNLVLHQEPVAVLLAWQQALPNKCSTEVWNMSFFAIIWSIWLSRNDMVFNGIDFDFLQITDTIKFRLAIWLKAKWPDCPNTISDIVSLPCAIQVSFKVKIVTNATIWKCPPLDSLKFNVDGSARGKPGPAGIGGLLKDCKSATKVIFSKSIGVADSNVAELLAVQEVLKLFVASRWASTHRLTIESDSSNVVN